MNDTTNLFAIMEQYKENSSIQIFEDFFPDCAFIKNATKNSFSYGWKSNNNVSYDQGHWNNVIFGDATENGNPLYDISQREDFYLKDVWETINIKLGSRRLRRVYFNGYTYGTDGYFHRDSTMLDVNKYKKNSLAIQETILCYCNEKWDPDWAGETVFMSTKDNMTMLGAVLPKFNRVAVFNGEILHAARSVSRACNNLRTIVVFKTIRDFYDEKNAVDFIRGLTYNIEHSGRTFFDHLYNCMMMLKDSGFSQEVYLAALYHSVYDTEFFKANLNISREKVTELIGPDSEKLAYLFCTLRPRLHTILNSKLSEKDRYNLCLMEYVNLIEQKVRNESQINELMKIIKRQETKTRKIKVDW